MTKTINPEKMKIEYVVLVASGNRLIAKYQKSKKYGEKSKWTHVAGSMGGYNIIESVIPRSRVADLQKRYVDKGFEIKVLKRKGQKENVRYKVAMWWATMNNLPYDILQFIWYPLSGLIGSVGIWIQNMFSNNKRFVCSELITKGFYKENDYLFGKVESQVVPADFDDGKLFDEIKDV